MISLNENRRFKQIYKRGRSCVGSCVVLYIMPNRLNIARIGVTVSKKIGKAVKRNRVRRRIKEIVRLLLPNLQIGFDYVIVARVKAVNVSYQELERNVHSLFKQGNCYRGNLCEGEKK